MTALRYIILLLCISSASIRADNILPGLVLNYSDFSYINSIAVGFDYVYFGSTNGIIRYNTKTYKWGDPLTGIEGLEGQNVQRIMVSRDDQTVWAKTEFGYYEYDETFGYWSPIDTFPTGLEQGKHLQPDPTYIPPPGFNYMSSGALIDSYGRRFPLTDILDDGWSNLWVGTWGLGVLHADVSILRLELLNFGLLQPDVSTICPDSGTLYIGGETQDSYRTGITLFDWKNDTFNFVETEATLVVNAPNVNDFAYDSSKIYAATDDGILIIDKDQKQIIDRYQRSFGLPINQVQTILVSGDTLYAGTAYGLSIINMKPDTAEESIKTILSANSILCLDKVADAIWIGTSQGAYRLDVKSGKLSLLSAPQIFENDIIYDIAHTDQSVSLAMRNNLVSINLETAEITSYPEVNNYGEARAVALQDSTMAVATLNGLLLYTVGAKTRHQLFTKYDGLPSLDIRDLVFDGDYLWIGSDLGLTRFWYKDPAISQ